MGSKQDPGSRRSLAVSADTIAPTREKLVQQGFLPDPNAKKEPGEEGARPLPPDPGPSGSSRPPARRNFGASATVAPTAWREDPLKGRVLPPTGIAPDGSSTGSSDAVDPPANPLEASANDDEGDDELVPPQSTMSPLQIIGWLALMVTLFGIIVGTCSKS